MTRWILISLSLLTAACGFSPVYGTLGSDNAYGSEEILNYVRISNIPDREGQMLRNDLIDRFYKSSRPTNPRYRLKVQPIKETLSELDITISSDSTRGQLRMDTKMTLSDYETREVLLERNIHALSSYNILGSEFATRVSEQNTRENVLNDLARQIENHTVLYFKRTLQ